MVKSSVRAMNYQRAHLMRCNRTYREATLALMQEAAKQLAVGESYELPPGCSFGMDDSDLLVRVNPENQSQYEWCGRRVGFDE